MRVCPVAMPGDGARIASNTLHQEECTMKTHEISTSTEFDEYGNVPFRVSEYSLWLARKIKADLEARERSLSNDTA